MVPVDQIMRILQHCRSTICHSRCTFISLTCGCQSVMDITILLPNWWQQDDARVKLKGLNIVYYASTWLNISKIGKRLSRSATGKLCTFSQPMLKHVILWKSSRWPQRPLHWTRSAIIEIISNITEAATIEVI